MNREEIVKIMKNYLGVILDVDIEDINEKESFFKLGVSSVQALKIVNKMRKELDIDINPVAMFEYNCIDEIAGYLMECVEERRA